MIAMAEPEPPNSNGDGGCVFGCLLIAFVIFMFGALPLVDYIFRWWF